MKNYKGLFSQANVSVPKQDGKHIPSVYFDNAATTPPFDSVLQAISSYAPYYGSIHRGKGYPSLLSTSIYESTRNEILNFVGCSGYDSSVIYVKNCTEAINKVAYRYKQLFPDCIILTTEMEHHSNDLPWREKFNMQYIPVDSVGMIQLDAVESIFQKNQGKIKLLTVTGVSNVTGYMNPIYDLAELAHNYDAQILVDGAQWMAHAPFQMNQKNKNRSIDFLTFSAHKMYAPFGTGVLVGRKDILSQGYSELLGGGTIKFVSTEHVIYDDLPAKEEAGSPNYFGVLALKQALITLRSLGMKNIYQHEIALTQYTIQRIKNIKGIILYGDTSTNAPRTSIITFNIQDLPHTIVADVLAREFGISVRNGCFCAMPYMQRLLWSSEEPLFTKPMMGGTPGMVRISIGLNNSQEEVDYLLQSLAYITSHKEEFVEKYQSSAFEE